MLLRQGYCCEDAASLCTQEAYRMFEGMVMVHDVTWHAMHGMGQW